MTLEEFTILDILYTNPIKGTVVYSLMKAKDVLFPVSKINIKKQEPIIYPRHTGTRGSPVVSYA